jgi:hypothetical protein
MNDSDRKKKKKRRKVVINGGTGTLQQQQYDHDYYNPQVEQTLTQINEEY